MTDHPTSLSDAPPNTGETLFVIDRAHFPALIDRYEEMCKILKFKPAELIAVNKNRPEVKYDLLGNTLKINIGVMDLLTPEELFSTIALETTKRAFMDVETLTAQYVIPFVVSSAASYGYKSFGGDAVSAFGAAWCVSWAAAWLALKPNTKLIDGVAADLSSSDSLHRAIDKLQTGQREYDRQKMLSYYPEIEGAPNVLTDPLKSVVHRTPEIKDVAMLVIRPKISVKKRQGHLAQIEQERLQNAADSSYER